MSLCHAWSSYNYYFCVHVTLSLLNTKEGAFFGGGGRDCYRKQINEGFD